MANKACAAPATVSKCGHIKKATEQSAWEGDVSKLASPDTGLETYVEMLREAAGQETVLL